MLLTAAAVVATSCVDDSKLLFSVDKPASIADMEYLNAYDALKTYVNSSANPDFKLGFCIGCGKPMNGNAKAGRFSITGLIRAISTKPIRVRRF